MSTVTLHDHMNIPLVNQVLGRCRRRQYRDELKRDVVAACTAPGVSMEYIRTVIQGWAKDMRVRLDYMQSGKPQRNAYVERFNRTVRYELLSQNHWSTVDEVQEHAAQWTYFYNHHRPHMARVVTPKQHLAKAA